LIPTFGSVESKFVSPSFLEHRYYAFTVKLNPVTRLANKTAPVIGHEPLSTWFLDKQEQWGFVVDRERLDLSDLGVSLIRKGNTEIPLNQCTYTGILKVVDRERFIDSFENGLGRGKGFGFGLLQLKPLR